MQELFGDALDFRRHGRGEEQRLAREWYQLADALDVGNEAHVEHAICLVDDKQIHAGHQQSSALVMIEQTSRRRDQNVDATRELGVLIVERHAADDQCDGELILGAVLDEGFLNLCREFARRLEDERARHPCPRAALFEHGNHWQHEGGGLAGAGLRYAEHVTARQNVRYGLLLDRGWRRVTGCRDGGLDFFGQTEIGEGHGASNGDCPRSHTAPDTER